MRVCVSVGASLARFCLFCTRRGCTVRRLGVHLYNQYANQCDAAAGVMGRGQLLHSKPLSLGSSDEQEVLCVCQTGSICMREGCAQTLGGPRCLGAPCSGQSLFPELTMVDWLEIKHALEFKLFLPNCCCPCASLSSRKISQPFEPLIDPCQENKVYNLIMTYSRLIDTRLCEVLCVFWCLTL